MKTYMQFKYILTYALKIFLFISTLKINDAAEILTLQTHCKPSWFFHSRSRDTLNDGTWKILFYFILKELKEIIYVHVTKKPSPLTCVLHDWAYAVQDGANFIHVHTFQSGRWSGNGRRDLCDDGLLCRY